MDDTLTYPRAVIEMVAVGMSTRDLWLDAAFMAALQDSLGDDGCWDWPHVIGLVKRHPTHDLPRYLAAAWFEAEGRVARARLVRDQCRLARRYRPLPSTDEGNRRACREFDELESGIDGALSECVRDFQPQNFDGHWLVLTPRTDEHALLSQRSMVSRGFVVRVHCSVIDGHNIWCRHAHPLWADHPIDPRGCDLGGWPDVAWEVQPADRLKVWLPGHEESPAYLELREMRMARLDWRRLAVEGLYGRLWPGRWDFPLGSPHHIPREVDSLPTEVGATGVWTYRPQGSLPADNGHRGPIPRGLLSPHYEPPARGEMLIIRLRDASPDPVAEHVSLMAETVASVREMVARHAVDRYRVDPGRCRWLEGAGVRPPCLGPWRYVQPCLNCARDVPLLVRADPGSFRPGDMRVVQLTEREPVYALFARPGGDVRHGWRVIDGQCPTCGEVYLAISPEPDRLAGAG